MTPRLVLGVLRNWMCFLHFCGRACDPGCEWQTGLVLKVPNPQSATKGDWMSLMLALSCLEGHPKPRASSPSLHPSRVSSTTSRPSGEQGLPGTRALVVLPYILQAPAFMGCPRDLVVQPDTRTHSLKCPGRQKHAESQAGLEFGPKPRVCGFLTLS